MYALFFHRLSILERATDHKCFNDCSYSEKEMWVGSNVTALWIFSQRGDISSNTCIFPPSPPPPMKLLLLSLVTPPPPQKSSVVMEAGTSPALGLHQGCSLYRRVTYQVWQSPLAYMKRQGHERIRSEHRRQEMADSGSSPSSPRFSCCPWPGTGDK
jgi:hypothetical protein